MVSIPSRGIRRRTNASGRDCSRRSKSPPPWARCHRPRRCGIRHKRLAVVSPLKPRLTAIAIAVKPAPCRETKSRHGSGPLDSESSVIGSPRKISLGWARRTSSSFSRWRSRHQFRSMREIGVAANTAAAASWRGASSSDNGAANNQRRNTPDGRRLFSVRTMSSTQFNPAPESRNLAGSRFSGWPDFGLCHAPRAAYRVRKQSRDGPAGWTTARPA